MCSMWRACLSQFRVATFWLWWFLVVFSVQETIVLPFKWFEWLKFRPTFANKYETYSSTHIQSLVIDVSFIDPS